MGGSHWREDSEGIVVAQGKNEVLSSIRWRVFETGL